MGVVSLPSAPDDLAANVRELLADPIRRENMGRNARAYAESTFDIERIADRFEAIISLETSQETARAT